MALFTQRNSVYNNAGTSFFRSVTKHAFDRRTDGQTNRQKGLRIIVRCIRLHAVAR